MALLRKLTRAAALIALMTGSAWAQIPPLPDNGKPPTKEEKEKQAVDAAYRASLKSIYATKKPTDPWAGVRSDAPVAAKNKPQ